jgi:hypothetical protein
VELYQAVKEEEEESMQERICLCWGFMDNQKLAACRVVGGKKRGGGGGRLFLLDMVQIAEEEKEEV